MAATADPVYHTSGFVRLTRPQLVGTLGGLLLALLVAALDQTVVGTAEPRIIASLSGFDRYPWVATAYMLSMTVSVPIFAKLSDIYGRKWFFLTGLVIFVLASAFCGASGQIPLPLDGMNQLILFRGIQGIGAGILFGLTFTIVGDVFSPAERGKYQGIFAAMWGLASIFGPTLGGWLTDHYSWRAVFYVNLPVGLVAAIAIWLEFPSFRPHGVKRKIDFAGVFALILCLVPLLLALTWVTDYGWESMRVESLLAFSTVMLVAFLFAETRASEPLIPLAVRAGHGDVRHHYLSASVHAGRDGRLADAIRVAADAFDDGRGGGQHQRRPVHLADRTIQDSRPGRVDAHCHRHDPVRPDERRHDARRGGARHVDRRARNRTDSARLYAGRAELGSARTSRRGDRFHAIFPLDRQHHGRVDFRQRAADHL
jgi:MFS family permease